MHNGFVNLGSEKMSKSLGNTLTVEALLGRHDPEALRLYFLQTHYRNPVELSDEGIAGMRRPLERFRELVDTAGALVPTEPESSPDGTFLAQVGALRERFEAAMEDDSQHAASDRRPEPASDDVGGRAGACPVRRAKRT